MTKLTFRKVDGFVRRAEELEARAEAYYETLKGEENWAAAALFANIKSSLTQFIFEANNSTRVVNQLPGYDGS